MPTLDNHQSNDYVKALLIGDAMAGKTGSLVSLVKAGYNLRILDLDNKLDILKYMIRKECPSKLASVHFRTIRDKYKPSAAGMMIDGVPKAWTNILKMLSHWKFTEADGTEVDLGRPSEWGPDNILVIDSLSRMCDAAYDFHDAMMPAGRSGDKDGRAVYGNAQDDVEKQIAQVTGPAIETNLLVTAHISYQSMPDGKVKGYPQGVGQKLSPKIAQYFQSAMLYTTQGDTRKIQTASTTLMDLANPAPFAMAKVFPIETGLADFFKVLREPPRSAT